MYIASSEEKMKCIRIVIVVQCNKVQQPLLLSCPITLIHELNFPFLSHQQERLLRPATVLWNPAL